MFYDHPAESCGKAGKADVEWQAHLTAGPKSRVSKGENYDRRVTEG
jgi:hypothetical protein